MNIDNIKEITVMKNSIRFLRICNIFPSKEELNQPQKKMSKKFAMLNLIAGYFPLGIAIHIIVNMTRGENDYLAEDFLMLLSCSGVMTFNNRYYGNIKKAVSIYKQYSDFKTFDKPEDFDTKNKLLNKLSVGYFVCHLMSVTFITVGSVLLGGKCREENERRGINEVCGMIARIWLPFDYDFFPVKQIVFIYELFATLLVYHNAGVISFAIFESIEHMNIRFQHLSETFSDALETEDPILRRKKFRKAVQYHYALLELGDLINKSYKQCCMVHIVLTAPVLGFSGYRLVTTAPMDSASMLIGWTLSTSLACTAGQRLLDASDILSYSLYQTEWHKLEKELQRDLVLVIIRSRRPMLLTAGPMGIMSFDMLVALGKTAYSYLTLLKQTV